MSRHDDSTDRRPVCLVTGGNSGIGLATALRFGVGGYRVVIAGRDRARLSQARRQVGVNGLCRAVVADLRRVEQCERLVEGVVDHFGRLDVLIHCAGVARLVPAAAPDPAALREMEQVNTVALAALCRAAGPSLQSRGGAIVYVSSMSALDPFPGLESYGETKRRGNELIRALAVVGKPFNIRTFAVCPGAVETPMLRSLFPGFAREQTLEPAEVAGLIHELTCTTRFASGSIIPFTKQN